MMIFLDAPGLRIQDYAFMIINVLLFSRSELNFAHRSRTRSLTRTRTL